MSSSVVSAENVWDNWCSEDFGKCFPGKMDDGAMEMKASTLTRVHFNSVYCYS